MDIARIGFAAETSGLDAATDSLQALVPASAAAESAANKTSGALSGMSASAARVADAAKGTATQTAATAKVMQAANGAIITGAAGNKVAAAAAGQAAAANDNLTHSHAGLSTQAMAAQHSIRSMVEGLASGMPVSTVLTQQLNHLSYAASGPGGLSKALRDAVGMFAKFINATTLVVGGIGAIVVAFGSLVLSAAKGQLALSNLSKQTDITMNDLRGLQQAAALKEITPDDFSKAMLGFSSAVNEAQHNMGSLNGLMIANGKSAQDQVGYFMQVAQLISQTTSGVQQRNIMEAAGLPSTIQWLNLMKQGPTAIKQIIATANQFNTVEADQMAHKAEQFADAWVRAANRFQNGIKTATINVMGWLQQQIDAYNEKVANGLDVPSLKIASRFEATNDNPVSAQRNPALQQGLQKVAAAARGEPAPNTNAQTQQQLLQQNALAQHRISLLGDLATVQQQVTAKQLELNAAGLQGVGVGSQQRQQILLGVQAQAEMNRVNQQAQIGIFNLSDAQRAASDTLQHWIDQGLVDKNNVVQMAAAQQGLANNIRAVSEAAAVAGAPLQQLKQLELDSSNSFKQFDTTATTALNNLVQPIQDVMNGVTGIAQGAKNMAVVVLQAIQQMIIKMLILAPIAKGLQSLFSGWTGLFGGLFGGGASTLPLPGQGSFIGPVANAAGGVYNSPSLSAYSGTIVSSPTLFRFANGGAIGEMGEAGPEGILPLKRGPGGSLGVQMYGSTSANNDNSTTVNPVYAPSNTYYLGGTATQADIDQLKKAQENDRKQFGTNVLNTLQQARVHNRRV